MKRTDQPYTTYALEYGLHNHVQGCTFHLSPTTIHGCSRVAGPFFSLPQHHRRLFKGCWSVLFTCPQQPSAAVWRRSKVQPLGAALHLRTKCNCLGAADGRPSLDEQMEICGKTYVPNIYIYIKTPPAQVAAGDDDHDCKWSIFASWWKEKHHQRKLHSVNTILGTSIGAGCSNQMQVAQGQDLH